MERKGIASEAHVFAAVRVEPAQALHDAVALLELVAELRVVLVDVQPEQGGIVGVAAYSICGRTTLDIGLHATHARVHVGQTRTSTSTLLVLRASFWSHSGSDGSSRNRASSARSAATSFAEAEAGGGSPLPTLELAKRRSTRSMRRCAGRAYETHVCCIAPYQQGETAQERLLVASQPPSALHCTTRTISHLDD